ncbi:MAG: hypothetical protein ACK4UK_00050 [Flavobacterium sp.]
MKKSVLKKEAAAQLKVSFQEFKAIKKHEEHVEKLMSNENLSAQNSEEIIDHLADVEAS